MVVTVIGPDGNANASLGRALAADLGWAFVDGDNRRTWAGTGRALPGGDDASDEGRVRELHELVERTLERREHLVVAHRGSAATDRAIIRGELRWVRFVCLGGDCTGHEVVHVDAAKPPATLVAEVREALGL